MQEVGQIGKVKQVMGPVVDVEFEGKELPADLLKVIEFYARV